MRSSLVATERSRTASSSGALPIETPLADPQSYSITPALSIPLDDQALCYYSRYYVEVPYGFPEIVDGHLKYASADWCYSQPQSILSLAIFAVSHATFGRARKSHAALAIGCKRYLNALVKTNIALKDVSEATHDEVLLAVMLLSFYENAVTDKMSRISNLQVMASRSFAHHDGAMAVLYLRRQLGQRTNHSIELDKLVRRQLMRSLLLRSMTLPIWLRNGSQYGEHGFALELDHCMVGAAELRHQASILCMDSVSLPKSNGHEDIVRLCRLLAEAQTLDNVLACGRMNCLQKNGTASKLYNRMGALKPATGFLTTSFTSTLPWDMPECGTATTPSVSLLTTLCSRLCPYSPIPFNLTRNL